MHGNLPFPGLIIAVHPLVNPKNGRNFSLGLIRVLPQVAKPRKIHRTTRIQIVSPHRETAECPAPRRE